MVPTPRTSIRLIETAAGRDAAMAGGDFYAIGIEDG
jgi:hypothetical protein